MTLVLDGNSAGDEAAPRAQGGGKPRKLSDGAAAAGLGLSARRREHGVAQQR